MIQRTISGGTERLLIDDTQAVLVVERDAGLARVLSWNDRGDEMAVPSLGPIGPTWAGSCSRSAGSARPTPVALTIDRRRQDVHWWAAGLRIMAMRQAVCARCAMLKRRAGLFWWGVPWPVSEWRRCQGFVDFLTSPPRGHEAGCGCCLNLKWRLLESPRSTLRRVAAWLIWAVTGEEWDVEIAEAACPFGLWPKAL